MARKLKEESPEEEKLETRVQELEEDDSGVVGGDTMLRSSLAKQYKTAQDAIRYFSLDWNEYENLLFVQGRTPDQNNIRISDGSLSTIIIERAGRVMAQMPQGSVQALGLQNTGKGMLMDLILEKYIYPNANEQYDLETKLFLWDMYSNTYGTMPMVYDWCETPNYTGPDCWLVPIRNFFPQQGRLSIQNSDFVFISTFISREYLQQLVEDGVDSYDLEAITEILAETKEGGLKPKARDDYLRVNPMFEYRRRAPFTDTGDIEVVTKYEAGEDGRWIDFCPDFANRVIRNILNPHKNGRIPVVLKYAMPTVDSIIGLSDMEKGRFMQYGIDTTLNLQIDAQKLRTYPPIKIVNGNVVMPTVRFQPGAKWLVSNSNDISHHQFPDIENNLNLGYQFLKGALANVTGQTTSQTSSESNSPVQGKTPQAIKAQNQNQSTRDAIDLKFMGKAVTELFEGMLDLINRVDYKKPIELYAFGDEVMEIARNYPDIKDSVKFSTSFDPQTGQRQADGKTAKITIKPSQIKNEKGYLYKIDPLSTMKTDQEQEHQQLLEIYQELMQNPGVIEQMLATSGQTLDAGELFTELIKTGGLRDWKKIIKPLPTAQNQGAGVPQQQQGGAPQMREQINIKDLPPTGQVQMAAQAGIQTTPQDWTGQAEMESELKTKQQLAVKQVAGPAPQPQVVSHVASPVIGDPDIAQAHAQIMAHSAAVSDQLGGQNA